MPNERPPDLSLFLDVLRVLEDIDAPYMVIGAFAATVYGSTRTTYDIDIVVDLSEDHIQALVDAYPPPRFYADPVQIPGGIVHGAHAVPVLPSILQGLGCGVSRSIDADRGDQRRLETGGDAFCELLEGFNLHSHEEILPSSVPSLHPIKAPGAPP